MSAVLAIQPPMKYLFKYKGSYFLAEWTTSEFLDSLEDFEIRDSDVFLVTYPKSGTVWTQNILSLIHYEGHRDGTEDIGIVKRVPWLENMSGNTNYISCPSPRLFTSHLPYYLVPKRLRNRRAKTKCIITNYVDLSIDPQYSKVIYVSRNPKDVLVSHYHFSKMSLIVETAGKMDDFMERFLAGEVLAGSWLDHVEGWYAHKDDFNILFLTYEEMKKDLRNSVLKICSFLGKKPTEEELQTVVDMATFDKMRLDPRSNYEKLPVNVMDKDKGCFLRKGTIGDWKNIMTIAQSERF